ncbi:acyl-CoA dehydrogenase family protein [Natronorubrum tibetense]|uniref:Acyl-CoA dehydrogenase n=1 Tax=Natronorubrum tibetense GA33 TaxID=1114856 RepID=L9VLD3_9EURY|nr:acyl-CoA dehydrogenase family protein [Natronorubrum tibetense]ELY37782.1 acyl-CoA dehydrogenase [Natronorubrum tibetense GA33]
MFGRSEEQQMLVVSIEGAIERDIEPVIESYEKDEPVSKSDAKAVLRTLSEQGMLGRDIPEEEGGAGLDHTDWALMFEQLPMQVDLLAMISSEVARTVHFTGSEYVRDTYLGPLLEGELIGCAAISEPGAGSNPREMQTIAERDGDEWVISGTKTWISNGEIADVAMVVAETEAGKTQFLIETDADGFHRERLEMLGRQYDHMAQLYLDEVRVPDAHVLGSPGEGLDRTYESFELGRANVALLGVKTARNALDDAIEYAQTRDQWGKPIGEHQLVQQLIADSATYVDAARLLAYRALHRFDEGDRASAESAMAKWFATEMAVEVTSNVVQVHGGIGLSRELDVERYFRDAQMLTIPEGTTQINKLIVARDMLGLSAFD